jgi:hypothetical protein
MERKTSEVNDMYVYSVPAVLDELPGRSVRYSG